MADCSRSLSPAHQAGLQLIKVNQVRKGTWAKV